MSKFTLQKMNEGKGPIKIPFKLPWLILSLMVLGLTTYLWQINSLVSYGYQIRELDKKTSELKEASLEMESQTVRLRSIQNIQSKIDQLSFAPVTQIEYLNPVTPVIAQK